MQVCWHDIKYAPQQDHDLRLKTQNTTVPFNQVIVGGYLNWL